MLEKEEKAEVEKMQQNRNEIEETLNKGREEEVILRSVLDTDRPDGFLQVGQSNVFSIYTDNRMSNRVKGGLRQVGLE